MAKKKKSSKAKTATKKKTSSSKSRKTRPFPASTFEDALVIAKAIQKYAPQGEIRRITLFDELGKSPESGPSRQLITNSSQYGLTEGGAHAEMLKLTPEGKTATNDDVSPSDRLRARFRLAFENIEPFKQLFDHFSGIKTPSPSVMKDFLVDHKVAPEFAQECIDTFISNAEFLGLLKTMSGAERLLTLEHALDAIPKQASGVSVSTESKPSRAADETPTEKEWKTTCFYITPIGEEGSPQRVHADLMTGSFIEPAMAPLKLKVIRADQIAEPGMITSQVIQHIKHSKLVIADLSHLNPNVFYEMALRHALKLPVVQIIRKSDKLPFDVGQVRSVVMDMDGIFSLGPVGKAHLSTNLR